MIATLQIPPCQERYTPRNNSSTMPGVPSLPWLSVRCTSIEKPVVEFCNSPRHEFDRKMSSHSLPSLVSHTCQALAIARQFRDATNQYVRVSGGNESSGHPVDYQF